MYISEKDIRELNGDDGNQKLREFIERKIPENYHLDYKERAYENTDSGKREFLKDVTGFANANGGNLIIGCKEPTDDAVIHDLLVGIPNGDEFAQNNERRCTSSIDPRIPGLRVIPVKISEDSWVVVVHIPPSLARPHMVSAKGHRSFYIRHTESTDPMSTHEIREAVFSSASAEAKAKAYLVETEEDTRKYGRKGLPLFLLQAMPLIPHEQSWDLFSDPVLAAVRGDRREQKYEWPNHLTDNSTPKATISGIRQTESRGERWGIEVHRNGYVSVTYWVHLALLGLGGEERKPTVDESDCSLFLAFGDLCEELLEATNSESPYLLSCKCLDAQPLELDTYDQRKMPVPHTQERDEIVWQPQMRQLGESFEAVTREWGIQLFNAFGLRGPE